MKFVAGATSMSILGQCMLQMGMEIMKGMRTDSLKTECLAGCKQLPTMYLNYCYDTDDIEVNFCWLAESKVDVEQSRPPLNI